MVAKKPPEPPEILEVNGVSYQVLSRRWGDTGIGSMILDANGRRWTCIAQAQPEQFEYGKSCWLKFQAPKGEEFSARPRYVTRLVKMLIDPLAAPIEPAWPEGAREAWVLAQELGAAEIATQDTKTGEVWCPDYTAPNPAGTGAAPLLEHLRICHAIDTTALAAIEGVNDAIVAQQAAHSAAHKRPVGGAGFTHRHVPEDLSII